MWMMATEFCSHKNCCKASKFQILWDSTFVTTSEELNICESFFIVFGEKLLFIFDKFCTIQECASHFREFFHFLVKNAEGIFEGLSSFILFIGWSLQQFRGWSERNIKKKNMCYWESHESSSTTTRPQMTSSKNYLPPPLPPLISLFLHVSLHTASPSTRHWKIVDYSPHISTQAPPFLTNSRPPFLIILPPFCSSLCPPWLLYADLIYRWVYIFLIKSRQIANKLHNTFNQPIIYGFE